MNLEELKKSNLIIFEAITGSTLYNLNTEKSDIDLCGIFKLPKEDFLSLIYPPQIIGNDKQDIKFYELKKFIELAKDCNPNIVEFLFIPKDYRKICDHTMEKLIENRSLFISLKAYFTFSGYAFAQVKKAKGQNKLIHNPEPIEPPKKEDFCWIIPISDSKLKYNRFELNFQNIITKDPLTELNYVPCRPLSLNQFKINLNEFHISALEHVSNTYRLYYYGDKAKGVFRGNDMLVCESIPLQDEAERFIGLLIYNEQEYEKALKVHKQYWDWVKNRNESRWIDQENKKVDFDCKNLMHCMRLLYSGKNILQTGEPIIRFEGNQREYLMDIRSGKYSYDEIMKVVEKEMGEMEEIKNNSKLPHGSDIKKINKLYKELMEI